LAGRNASGGTDDSATSTLLLANGLIAELSVTRSGERHTIIARKNLFLLRNTDDFPNTGICR